MRTIQLAILLTTFTLSIHSEGIWGEHPAFRMRAWR